MSEITVNVPDAVAGGISNLALANGVDPGLVVARGIALLHSAEMHRLDGHVMFWRTTQSNPAKGPHSISIDDKIVRSEFPWAPMYEEVDLSGFFT